MNPLPSVEQIECVIRRMTRLSSGGYLVLADYSERDLAIAVRDLFKGTAFDDIRTIVVHQASHEPLTPP